MEAAMVNDALKMAFRRRTVNEGLIIHSDQGVQYASSEFRGILKAFNAIQSMSRKGDCWDNAVAESFFATIKGELIDRQHWINKAHARLAIVEWIECFYNNQRRHSSIGGVCPVEYESLTSAMQAA
jgi:transposase InsO family protein